MTVPQVWTVANCGGALVMGRRGDGTLLLSRELWSGPSVHLGGYLSYNYR